MLLLGDSQLTFHASRAWCYSTGWTIHALPCAACVWHSPHSSSRVSGPESITDDGVMRYRLLAELSSEDFAPGLRPLPLVPAVHHNSQRPHLAILHTSTCRVPEA
mmetsp:Transcript_27910/g.64414  ORF Transcript_27910/g.64414 Transcript_27910/m.64414 type:complete len:105 (-) Transcript_27910:114-428(-)